MESLKIQLKGTDVSSHDILCEKDQIEPTYFEGFNERISIDFSFSLERGRSFLRHSFSHFFFMKIY